jgi:uncharacterized membrane protein (DUF2068 family)
VKPISGLLPSGFQIIGAFKLISAGLSLAVGFGLFRLFKTDVSASLERAICLLQLDPQNHYIHEAISWLAGIDRKQLHLLEAGTFFYALLHMIEGIGLLWGKAWGGYLIIVATSSLIPFECYEIVRRLTPARIAILVLNLVILIYIIANRSRLTAAGPTGQAARQSADTPGAS